MGQVPAGGLGTLPPTGRPVGRRLCNTGPVSKYVSSYAIHLNEFVVRSMDDIKSFYPSFQRDSCEGSCAMPSLLSLFSDIYT